MPLAGPSSGRCPPRLGAWGMPGKSIIGAALPDPPFRGYHLHCPRRRRGEEREARAGWGERGERCMGQPPGRALPGLSPRYPSLPRGGPVGRAGMVLFDGEGVPSPAPPPGDAHHGPVHGMTPVKDTIGPAFPGDFTITIPELRGAGWGREENNIQICLPGPSPGRRLPRSGARDDAGEGYTLGPNPPDIPFLRGPGEIGKLCTTLHQGVRKNRHVR